MPTLMIISGRLLRNSLSITSNILLPLPTSHRRSFADRSSVKVAEQIYSNGKYRQQRNRAALVAAASVTTAGLFYFTFVNRRKLVHLSTNTDDAFAPPNRTDLPTFTRADVALHDKNAPRIWATYRNAVYDITEFVQSHPGGDKILLAAGTAVDPYWSLYAQHKTNDVLEILETMRIGNLEVGDVQPAEIAIDAKDPFRADPSRHPALIVNSQKPFNAETPLNLLSDHFITPTELFFIRNHLPVPQTDASTHRLRIDGLGISRPLELSVDDLRHRFKPVSVISVVQCAGNRRAHMSAYKKAQGLAWQGAAIGNAEWTGVRLRDVLILAGIDPDDRRIKHVQFTGADSDPEGWCVISEMILIEFSAGNTYGASIPFEKAMSPEVIIAYEMNGSVIPRDHGHPLRLIAPGIVGARQVKWLTGIYPSADESSSHWQQRDYRVFPSSIESGAALDFSSVPSIQEMPVQSAICTPTNGSTIDCDSEEIDVSGYAWAGGGRGIIRVEVSIDEGKTWICTDMQQKTEQDMDHMWSWTLWRGKVPIPKNINKLVLICKATDRAYNTQPETSQGIWNIRGLLNNSWHRVEINVINQQPSN